MALSGCFTSILLFVSFVSLSENICTPNSIGFSTVFSSFNSLKIMFNLVESLRFKVAWSTEYWTRCQSKSHYTHGNVMCFCCLKYVHVNCFEIAIANEITIATAKKNKFIVARFQWHYNIYSSAETIDTIFFAGDGIDCDSLPFRSISLSPVCLLCAHYNRLKFVFTNVIDWNFCNRREIDAFVALNSNHNNQWATTKCVKRSASLLIRNNGRQRCDRSTTVIITKGQGKMWDLRCECHGYWLSIGQITNNK